MNGSLIRKLRSLHTWLGVFFSPLLLLFVITGWWQTFATEETKDHGYFNGLMAKVATIHTDDYIAHGTAKHEASETFKILVGIMAAALIISIALGLVVAFRTRKFPAMSLAFGLGIAVPILILLLT